MRHLNIFRKTEWFEVLKTTERSQVAVMKLGPGQSTGEQPEDHKNSDQVLLVIEGELSAEIDGKRSLMKVGDFVIIPPRTQPKFTNRSDRPAITFNVYSPPEYPADTKG
jgi:mannose-6-phosphate isomerase-like protein (cupin superfamily)